MGDFRDGPGTDDAPKAGVRVACSVPLLDKVPQAAEGVVERQLILNGRMGAVVVFDVGGGRQVSYTVHPTEMKLLAVAQAATPAVGK